MITTAELKAALPVVLLLVLVGCRSPEPPADAGAGSRELPPPSAAYVQLRDEALELGRQGRFRDAALKIRDALEVDPHRREAYVLASRFFEQGLNDPGAVEFFDYMTGTMPDLPWPWYYRGFHQGRLGQWSESAAALGRAAALLPDLAEVRFFHSQALEQTGDLPAALAEMREARRLDPDSGPVGSGLTRLLAFQGELDEAERTYNETRLGGVSSPDLLHALAVLRSRQGRLDEAETALRETIRMKPGHLEARLELVQLLERSGRVEEAAREQTAAGRLQDYETGRRAWATDALAGSDPLPSLALAELELTEGNVDHAMVWFGRAARLGGETDRLLAGRAEALFASGRLEDGDLALARVRRPSDPRVALARAVRFLSTDDAAMARVQLDKAVKDGPAEREFLRRASDLYIAAGFEARSAALLKLAEGSDRAYTAGNHR